MVDDNSPTAEESQATEDRRTERLVRQLSDQLRRVARSQPAATEPATVDERPSNMARAEVPWAFDVAAAYAWRFLVVAAALGLILAGLNFFAEIVFPLVIALFISALTAPVVALLERIGIRRGLAALIVVLGGLAVIVLLLVFVTQQIASGAGELSEKVSDGLGQIEHWLRTGPLHASDSQVNRWIGNSQDFVTTQGKDLATHATDIGVAVGQIIAGFFIVLFATYFFLADGGLIWAWVVRIFPRAARKRADSSGKVAWHSLTQFVRATVLVAGTDAIGVMIIAAILKVPLIGAIGVLVFIGAFVPLIGAFASGGVAVLVALVAHGPIVALIMLGGVVLIQQIEAHVLQPFLMGRFVSVHPLGVILAIAAGVIVAGVAGAVIAVPLAAALNAVVQHLASFTDLGDDAEQAAAADPDPDGEPDVGADADSGADSGAEPEPV
ncbi:MAG TPA: AI-2E family transporter [Marmoricola sp.]|jgi:predicted PurR-regulated permease PerM|nr:AI-2E family transporter [Marmoricola sp.]